MTKPRKDQNAGSIGDDLIKSLCEALAHARGEMVAVRTNAQRAIVVSIDKTSGAG